MSHIPPRRRGSVTEIQAIFGEDPFGSLTQSTALSGGQAVLKRTWSNTVGVAGVMVNPAVAPNGGITVPDGTNRMVTLRDVAFE